MPEVAPNFPREWLEFFDPANPEILFKCDLTWLTSYWNCIYGSGCQGIEKDNPDAGCCSDGAYYTDVKDEAHVVKAAKRLTPDLWQFYNEARKGKKFIISEVGLDQDRKTKKINGSCIFLNRKGFSGGMGCALHHLAKKEDKHFFETKPDVCWQLPIRRSFEVREFGDSQVLVTVIGEYERLAWGEGGADFDWYCTSNDEAHNGSQPLYLSSKTELIQLMGKDAYQYLFERCQERMELIHRTKRKTLPLIVIHPATVIAQRNAGTYGKSR